MISRHPDTAQIGVIYDSVSEVDVGPRCSVRGCPFPASDSELCALHSAENDNPVAFQGSQPTKVLLRHAPFADSACLDHCEKESRRRKNLMPAGRRAA